MTFNDALLQGRMIDDDALKSIQELAAHTYGLHAVPQPLPGEVDLNFRLTTDNGDFILKIAHPETTRDQLDMQNQLLKHLAMTTPDLQLPRVVNNRQGENLTVLPLAGGGERFLRVLTWVPGRLWADLQPKSANLLASLGQTLGLLSQGLENFDHPGAHRQLKWDPSRAGWTASHLSAIEDEAQRSIAAYFLELYEQELLPRSGGLRRSVIYGDANDYNILVSRSSTAPEVVGVIDFGDTLYTHTINELAIAIAYASMDKPDPLAAAMSIVEGYHQQFPLQEAELEVLFPLICSRLLISVVVSAINRQEHPDNEYLQISDRPAWALLEKLRRVPPALAHYSFRHACGFDPHPAARAFRQWAEEQPASAFAPVVAADLSAASVTGLDLSVGSLDLGHNANFEDDDKFEATIVRLLAEAGASVGLGGYGEVRPFYTTDAYRVERNNGPAWRTVHLGLDIWVPAGTTVFAPLDATVYSVRDNAGDRNYGPTVILQHRPSDGPEFYTLYGHLGGECLRLRAGDKVGKGAPFATVGSRPGNGNWPPHLHYQVMLDPLGSTGDFPGVAFPETREVWLGLCPDPALLTSVPLLAQVPSRELSLEEILARRRQYLGRNLSLSYRKPLKIVRAYRQFLYDDTGRRYLDTVNNVAHVGHQHPMVVRAAQRQLAVLNTNTRYLHEELVRFAEELTATLPTDLSVCYFVNSGSEANELALRLARTFTDARDMVVVEVGYHGNTGGTIDISSYKFDGKGGRGAPPHVQVVPMPDTFRGRYRRPDPDAGRKYANHVGRAIAEIQNKGRQVAGFICESVLSCGGQIVLPEGYLRRAYQQVRDAGGVCIADEVQVGFGRPGATFWGFEAQGVVPDIVTMGKPIGNGHPLGAVVTTPAIAAAFNNGMEYFNTFGGNPVSCAVGRAVLQVIREEDLQKRALVTGSYLMNGLQELQQRFPIIGDVRGSGLFLGFELISDPDKLRPATAQAGYLANRARDRGILMSTDGRDENVLKIKPPMCFSETDADFLLETLDDILKEDYMRV